MAHHLGDARDVRIHRQPDGDAALGQRPLVVRHPLVRLLGVDEGEGQRPDPLLGRQQDRVAPRARHPQRRVRLLHRLGHDVARWHLHEAPVDTGERRLGHAAERDLQSLEPGVPLGRRVDQEASQLGLRARLARPELDPAARDEVQGGHALGRAGGVVVAGRGLNDAVPEPDVLGPLAAGAEEHLGRRGVAVLLQEVVLDLPDDVEPEAVGQLDLFEGILHERGTRRPPPTAAGAGARRRCRTSCAHPAS